MTIQQTDQTFVANTYRRFDIAITGGKGAVCQDAEGKSYIDLGAGIAVNTFGYCDTAWSDAVKAQLTVLSHTSNLYYTSPCAQLAQLLCQKTGMKKVFFGNSGAEANECALKVARKFGTDQAPEKYKIITLGNSFHGRTIATLAATGQEVFHTHFGPFPEGFLYAEANNLSSVEQLMDDTVCAVLMEPVQGEGGVVPLQPAFVQGVQALCRRHNALLMMDEVQTGNGRTGTLYAYMQYGVQPDVITTAKGLGGGLPIGACLLGERCEHTLSFGDHGSTFGGNPICAAGALSILQRLDDSLMHQVREKSRLIVEELSNCPGVKSVTGLGLMLGVETEKPAKDVVHYCAEHGVLVLTAKQKIRLLPPLNIPLNLLKQAIVILKEGISQ